MAHHAFRGNGAPERIRTSGLCLRRAALYPAELRVPMRPDSKVAASSQVHPCTSITPCGRSVTRAVPGKDSVPQPMCRPRPRCVLPKLALMTQSAMLATVFAACGRIRGRWWQTRSRGSVGRAWSRAHRSGPWPEIWGRLGLPRAPWSPPRGPWVGRQAGWRRRVSRCTL